MARDVTADEQRFTRGMEHPLTDLADQAPVVLFVCDEGRPRYVSPASTELLGETPECYLAEPWRWNRDRSRLHEVSTTVLEDGVHRTYGALVAVDAARDPVTKLPGRSLLRSHLALAAARARQADATVAVLHLGIEGLDLVAAGLGRAAHDAALREIAGRALQTLPDTAMMSAPADGELTIMLADLDGRAAVVAEATAGQLLECSSQPLCVDGETFELSAYVGISLLPTDAPDADAAMRHAEAAMAEARRADGTRVAFYDGGTSEAVERLLVTARLRRAIENDELVLHYQPIVSLPSGRITAVEALLRWEDPERGLVPPLDFVPVAEYTGMIEPLGRWVIDACCQQAVAWRDAGLDVSISFNVSPRQFRDPAFAESLGARIAAHDLDPRRFIVEITETAAMRDPACIEPVLEALKELGVRLAIDDFGAGHSSLARLRDLEVDLLKIDRTFLGRDDARSIRLVRAALDLAGALDVTPVVEGVETEEQRRFLVDGGCGLAQGFHLHRPVTAGEATALLQRSSASSAPSG
jgi:EAL domain-containing protein (putative c-di-GMP-specific phosphodiesterase class I)/GGDEF domain-containing protein